jgi:hypothetical protein
MPESIFCMEVKMGPGFRRDDGIGGAESGVSYECRTQEPQNRRSAPSFEQRVDQFQILDLDDAGRLLQQEAVEHERMARLRVA